MKKSAATQDTVYTSLTWNRVSEETCRDAYSWKMHLDVSPVWIRTSSQDGLRDPVSSGNSEAVCIVKLDVSCWQTMFKKVRILIHDSIKPEAWKRLLVLTASLCRGSRWLCRRIATGATLDSAFSNSSSASTSQHTNKHSNMFTLTKTLVSRAYWIEMLVVSYRQHSILLSNMM